MKTRILSYILIGFLLGGCKHSSQKESSASQDPTGLFESNSKDESLIEVDAEGNNLDEKTSLNTIYSEEAIDNMVSNGIMSEIQAEQLRMEMKRMNAKGPDSAKDEISDLSKNFESMLTEYSDDSGLDSLNVSDTWLALNEKERAVINLRKSLGVNRPYFIEEYLKGWYGASREKRKMAFRKLSSSSNTSERTDEILMEFFEIDENELSFLKMLPPTEKIISESEARKLSVYELPAEFENHLDSSDASEALKYVYQRFALLRNRTARAFLKKAKTAREEFYKVNPGWYANTDESGDTYIDSHRNYIHLPLGKLSFADRLISHEMDIKNGNYPEGAVGTPDMAVEDIRVAHPKVCNLGTRGVLTLEFKDNAIVDVNGPDLYVFEMGAIEPTNLEISKDGENWIEVGRIDGGTAAVDIAKFVKPKETYNYIRLTDLVTSSTLPGADVDAVAAIGGALRLNLDSSVLFDTGKHELKSSASSSLEQLVASILEMPEGTIIIEGHTDNVGNPASNKTLSENRAKTVRDYLKTKLKGVYKFQIKGFGESQPVAPNNTDENKQKNRRVEILVIPS